MKSSLIYAASARSASGQPAVGANPEMQDPRLVSSKQIRSRGQWALKEAFTALGLLSLSGGAIAADGPDCRQQKTEQSVVEMCLHPGPPFQHDVYTLKVDKKLIFALVDDFAESVSLEHAIPEGPALEFPLSRQGEKSVKISGGCVPESKDNLEIARVCNFHWGRFHVVKDVRFEFK